MRCEWLVDWLPSDKKPSSLWESGFSESMANTRSAAKRARQTLTRTRRNRSVVARLRSMQKHARSTPSPSAEEIRTLVSAIDKAAKRGIIHRNAATRRKARLNKALAGTK
jgi:small subunit ribosomal protein S20